MFYLGYMYGRTFQIFCEVGVNALELFDMEVKKKKKHSPIRLMCFHSVQ